MKKNCEVCKKEFDVKPSTYDRRKTCSKACFSKMKTQKIKCACGYCGKTLLKTKSQIEKSTSGNVFCDNICVGKYNQIQRSQDIEITCAICGVKKKTIKSRDSHVTCSNKCQGEWQSRNRVGEKASNYRGGGKTKFCEYCNKGYVAGTPYHFKTRRFCSTDCKVSHWKENTLHNSEDFKKAHFEGNLKYRKESRETKPEKLVREYLEDKGLVRGKDFEQEQGFFRKYFADFFIFKSKTVIEVHGDFWHGNPEIYGDELIPLYESQKERIRLDKIKEDDFKKFGFNYHVIWEKDIYEDIENSLKKVKL